MARRLDSLEWDRQMVMYVIILHEEKGMTFGQIAKGINLTTPTVTQPIRKAGFRFKRDGTMYQWPSWYKKG
jgi:Mn-dependent DtxR family transcriptional regulator